MMGRRAYPQAEALYITANAGGSNGCRSRPWKDGLQRAMRPGNGDSARKGKDTPYIPHIFHGTWNYELLPRA
jgi:hypothetical protein